MHTMRYRTAMLVCMLAYRIPIVRSLLAVASSLLSFGWLAKCFRAVYMLSAYRSACRMLTAFILFAEFADSVACRTARCQHAVVRVAIMLSASRHAFRMARDGSLCAWLAYQYVRLWFAFALCLSAGALFASHAVFL